MNPRGTLPALIYDKITVDGRGALAKSREEWMRVSRAASLILQESEA